MTKAGRIVVLGVACLGWTSGCTIYKDTVPLPVVRHAVLTREAPMPVGPYSQAIAAGDLVFVAGQIGVDPASGNLADGIAAQTDRAISNIEAVLRAEGLGLASVVRVDAYMVDLAEFAAMNEVYARRFPADPPARATVQVAALPKGARIEMAAVAHR